MLIAILTAKGAKYANKKGSVPCSPEEVLEGEGGKVKRSVRSNSNREIRESLYCLFLLVRAVRVVRGSWNLNGVSLVASDLTKMECPL